MGLLPDTQNCRSRKRRECRERFLRHWFQRKPLVSDPGMHHGTCVTHVPWCMSGSLTHGGGENVPGIPGACAHRNFAYLVRGPCHDLYQQPLRWGGRRGTRAPRALLNIWHWLKSLDHFNETGYDERPPTWMPSNNSRKIHMKIRPLDPIR